MPQSTGDSYVLQRRPLSTVSRNDIERIEKVVKKITGTRGFVREVNQASVDWIKEHARDNLRESIAQHGRPDFGPFNGGGHTGVQLEEAIMDDQYHDVQVGSFALFVDKKIRPAVPYYRALEFGSDSQIGRRIPFFFLSARKGANSKNFRTREGHVPAADTAFRTDPRSIFNRFQKADSFRNSANSSTQVDTRRGEVSDRIVGPREHEFGRADRDEKNLAFVTIRNPVPAYKYFTKAGNQFDSEQVYKKLITEYGDRFFAANGVKIRLV